MLRFRMVRRVHGDGLPVVIDGDVGPAADADLDAQRRPAPASKRVDDQLVVVQPQDRLAVHEEIAPGAGELNARGEHPRLREEEDAALARAWGLR
jgi:hypothetical protein